MVYDIPTYSISTPEYSVASKPDYEKIGSKLDSFIKNHFLGKKVCIRALGTQDHKLSTDALIEKIKEAGTDKYDLTRTSFWEEWDVYKGKGIDLFACFKEITADFKFMHEVVGDFYEGAQADRGYSVKVDLLLFYDAEKLEMVPIKYAQDDIGEDAWKFKFPENKQDALTAIVRIE